MEKVAVKRTGASERTSDRKRSRALLRIVAEAQVQPEAYLRVMSAGRGGE